MHRGYLLIEERTFSFRPGIVAYVAYVAHSIVPQESIATRISALNGAETSRTSLGHFFLADVVRGSHIVGGVEV